MRKRGKVRVRMQIERAGIATATAKRAVDEVFDGIDDDALLEAALAKRLRGRDTVADDREFQRLYRYLVGQGFESRPGAESPHPAKACTMSLRTLCLLIAASGAIVAAQPPPSPRYETILRRGTIVDGTGGRLYQADVGIHNGHLARIGNLSNETALVEIDVAGLYVAPGFINIHSHASPAALATAENMLTQGVTTEIVNPDGGGPPDIAQQLNDANSGGLALNVGAYIGFNSVWAQVMGAADRRATPEDIERMRTLVLTALDRGAWGVSAGLDYKPAYYAQTEEVIRVVEAAAPWRTNFPNHDRLTPESGFSSRAGVAETIAIGEKAGVMPVVTHMKAQGLEQGTAARLLAMMQDATRRGRYTAADAYPYLAGQTEPGRAARPRLGAGRRPRRNAEALQGSVAARADRRGDRERR